MPSIVNTQHQTPGVVALIPISRDYVKFAAQTSIVRASANGRVDNWPVYSRIMIATREEVGQLLGGN